MVSAIYIYQYIPLPAFLSQTLFRRGSLRFSTRITIVEQAPLQPFVFRGILCSCFSLASLMFFQRGSISRQPYSFSFSGKANSRLFQRRLLILFVVFRNLDFPYLRFLLLTGNESFQALDFILMFYGFLSDT